MKCEPPTPVLVTSSGPHCSSRPSSCHSALDVASIHHHSWTCPASVTSPRPCCFFQLPSAPVSQLWILQARLQPLASKHSKCPTFLCARNLTSMQCSESCLSLHGQNDVPLHSPWSGIYCSPHHMHWGRNLRHTCYPAWAHSQSSSLATRQFPYSSWTMHVLGHPPCSSLPAASELQSFSVAPKEIWVTAAGCWHWGDTHHLAWLLQTGQQWSGCFSLPCRNVFIKTLL